MPSASSRDHPAHPGPQRRSWPRRTRSRVFGRWRQPCSCPTRTQFSIYKTTCHRWELREHYPDTSFDVIVLDGQPVGRLYVARWPDEIRIVDIALLPACCNRGLGTTLVRALQAEAAASRKPLRIHVERFNPALRLYERLGFRQIADRGVYLFMEWRR